MSIDLNAFIRDVPDFPKPGILFKDITPLLADSQAMQAVTDRFVEAFKDQNIKTIVGIESRGFLFGVPLALALGVGFVPIRKPGKLPAETIKETYELEYGTDTIEIHRDAVQEGDRVLIVDDLLATGGTAAAAGNIIKRLGGDLVGFAFLIELGFLKGRDKLAPHSILSLLTYND
jgi:adenine phosphoribosyltransferase